MLNTIEWVVIVSDSGFALRTIKAESAFSVRETSELEKIPIWTYAADADNRDKMRNALSLAVWENIESVIEVKTTTGIFYTILFVPVPGSKRALMISQESKPPIDLTEREAEILTLLAKEFTAAEIAERIELSASTVRKTRERLIQKTGSRTAVGLGVWARENGYY